MTTVETYSSGVPSADLIRQQWHKNQRVLIGIAGVKRSGKGSTATVMKQWASECTLTSHERGFADYVKLSIGRAFGVPDGEAIAWCDRLKMDESFMELHVVNNGVARVSGRNFIAQFATEGHRNLFGANFWVDRLMHPRWHEKEFDCADVCMISDIRFDNEADAVRRLGGQIWHMRGRGEIGEHASEQGLMIRLGDSTIDNSGSLDGLEQCVRSLLPPSLP